MAVTQLNDRNIRSLLVGPFGKDLRGEVSSNEEKLMEINEERGSTQIIQRLVVF